MDARAKLLEIERLDEIVVRAGVEPGHQIRAAVASCEQDHVHVRASRVLPDASTEPEPVERGHHPIENRQRWVLGRGQQVPRRAAVVRDGDIEVPSPQ